MPSRTYGVLAGPPTTALVQSMSKGAIHSELAARYASDDPIKDGVLSFGKLFLYNQDPMLNLIAQGGNVHS